MRRQTEALERIAAAAITSASERATAVFGDLEPRDGQARERLDWVDKAVRRNPCHGAAWPVGILVGAYAAQLLRGDAKYETKRIMKRFTAHLRLRTLRRSYYY